MSLDSLALGKKETILVHPEQAQDALELARKGFVDELELLLINDPSLINTVGGVS